MKLNETKFRHINEEDPIYIAAMQHLRRELAFAGIKMPDELPREEET